MKLYHENTESVKGSIQILNPELLESRACKGLAQLSIELGLEVVRQIMELEAAQLAGAKGTHNPERTAYRHGYEGTKIVLGGEKIAVNRPRIRAKGGAELPLETLEKFQNEDHLNQKILAEILCGVSTRKYERTQEYQGSCISKSEVSRRFIKEMQKLAGEFLTRDISDDYVAVMLDGMGFSDITIVAAMGITADGHKRILGLVEGGSENAEVVKTLLSDLISRGLDPAMPRLYVLDGGKALHKAVVDTFGENAVIQRCQVHKKRNVLSHLPKSEQTNIGGALTKAYREFDYSKAKHELELIAQNLEYRYPDAAKSLTEGLEETLTVHKLGVPGLLRKTLSNTNAMESANSMCARATRRTTRFKDGETALRHAAAGFMEAERCFRRVRGYREIQILKISLNSLTKQENHVKLSA